MPVRPLIRTKIHSENFILESFSLLGHGLHRNPHGMAFHLDLQSILLQLGRDPFCRSCPNGIDSMFYHT